MTVQERIEILKKRYIGANGDNILAFRNAILNGILGAREHGCEISLVIPTLKQIDNPVPRSMFVKAERDQLKKTKNLSLSGVKINLIPTQSFNGNSKHGVIVGLWAGDYMLAKFDSCSDYRELIVLFWNDCTNEDWIAKNHATEIKFDES